MSIFTDSTHIHIFSWVVGIVLFLAATQMKIGSKGRKVLHMITRLFYILIIVSGAFLFFKYQTTDSALYGIKFLAGLLTVAMMEMVLVKADKGKDNKMFWILFVVFLLVTLFLGLKLPFGMEFF